MAKVGYIMATSQYDKLEEDRKWMNEFGCVRIIEESDDNERHRPLWKQLMAALQRGDELVIPKFSNALRGSRELAIFLNSAGSKSFASSASTTGLTPATSCFRKPSHLTYW